MVLLLSFNLNAKAEEGKNNDSFFLLQTLMGKRVVVKPDVPKVPGCRFTLHRATSPFPKNGLKHLISARGK